MRIVAIVGSIRRGNTYAMVEAGCHALSNCDVELIHLKDVDVKMCDGCLRCDEKGKCHIKDDMKEILPRIKEADGFIIGTPSRWGLLSGELKVLLDRLNPLAVPELLKGKKAIVFAVGQSSGKDATSIKLAAESVKTFCESAGVKVVSEVFAENCLGPEDLITKQPAILDICKNAAKNLYIAISE